MPDKERVLLPTSVRPQRYDLSLAPDLEQHTFSGSETVELEVRAPTERVVLHAAEIEFQSVTLRQNGKEWKPGRIDLDSEEETAAFVFPEALTKGAATLSIEFTGGLNDQMRGFYRSVYKVDGRERTMAVTQFESTDARRAFPCWDEPAVKAVFEVTLVVPQDRVAISNMPAERTEVDTQGRKVVRFGATPVMSTYLLAFIVGELDALETRTGDGVVVRVFTPVGKKEQGRFALDVAARTLSFFSEYFAIRYPLPKMDLIAIPDFAAGAMENWGAVTYRETAILIDPEQSSAATRQRVAIIIAHELAHQWFGNLVTMEWWTHLWLNEGFASWIEYLAVDHLFPEWDIWTQFVFNDLGRALSLDSLKNSHPIEVEVGHPSEISEIFDAISYSKGASVIRMLAAYLGADVFRKGLQRYLTRHQFANATTEDLWRALAEESGKPVKQVMDTWTKQAGYPVLSAQVEGGAGGALQVTQSRFLLSGKPDAGDSSQWLVPISVTGADGNEKAAALLEGRELKLKAGLAREGWIKLNPGQTGFYRTNYSASLWKQLEAAIAEGRLAATDRLGLESDAFALTRAGYLSTTQALSLALAYRNESDYTVWADLSSNLHAYDSLLCGEPYYGLFRSYARDLYAPVHERLGWDAQPNESHLTTMLRPMVIGILGSYGDAAVAAEAGRRFDEASRCGVKLPPDLRSAVYGLVVENRGAEGHAEILKLFRSADLNEEKTRCLRALGRSPDAELLRQTLELSLSAEVRSQDTPLVVAGVAANRLGRDLAWQFLRERWGEFDRRYGRGGFLIARLIAATTEDFTTLEKAAEVEKFFEAHPAPAAARTIRQSLERIRSNALWLDRDREAIGAWLETYQKTT